METKRSILAAILFCAVASAARADSPERTAAADEATIGPPSVLPDCAAKLDAEGVEYRLTSLALRQKRGATYTCGAEQAVVYRRGPERVRWSSPPLVSCGLALALARFERILNDEATRRFGKRVARVEQGGTYNCRKMTRFQGLVSEHSYANAIDVRAFVLSDGRRISVLRDFGPLDREPPSERSRFLRDLARRLYDEAVFSVVLTPYWDALHRDHFHFDMARYRVDGTR